MVESSPEVGKTESPEEGRLSIRGSLCIPPSPTPCPPKGEKRALCKQFLHSYFLVRLFLFREKSGSRKDRKSGRRAVVNSAFVIYLSFSSYFTACRLPPFSAPSPKGVKRSLCKRLQHSYFLVRLFFNKKVRRVSPCPLWFQNR